MDKLAHDRRPDGRTDGRAYTDGCTNGRAYIRTESRTDGTDGGFPKVHPKFILVWPGSSWCGNHSSSWLTTRSCKQTGGDLQDPANQHLWLPPVLAPAFLAPEPGSSLQLSLIIIIMYDPSWLQLDPCIAPGWLLMFICQRVRFVQAQAVPTPLTCFKVLLAYNSVVCGCV